MDEKNELIVGGYRFGMKEDAKIAELELEKINLLCDRINWEKPIEIYAIYNKAMDNRIFKTPVGFEFLRKMQDYLQEHVEEVGEIKPISLFTIFHNPLSEYQNNNKIRRNVKTKMKKKFTFKTSILLNIVFGALIILMFFISFTGKNTTILNYKKNLTNQYAQWEQDLSDREKIIREKERELKISK